MKVIVIGGTGFIGKALIPRLLRDGHQVTAWVRNPKTATGLPCAIEVIDFSNPQLMSEELTGKDLVINLAGEPVSQTKWTPEFKKSFLESRTLVTRSLVSALKLVSESSRPRHLINASAIGIYGDRGSEVLDEKSADGEGYLASVCQHWEAEAKVAEPLQVRTVLLRIGIVLGRSGGMLSKLVPVRLGTGEQWVSWIHIDDVVEMILFSMRNESLRGPVNVVAPNPVTQDQMNGLLAKKYKLPYVSSFFIPRGILKLLTGELANVVLSSQRCVPSAMTSAGFFFRFANLESALDDLIDGCEEWVSWQVVQRPLNEVFSFFSRAENLETLTPPWLNFKILSTQHPAGAMDTGSLIDYSLKVHGIPIRWRTLIDQWVLNQKFVDTQVRGPYQYWHHTHEFYSLGDSTLMLDRVRYRLPLGKLGKAFGGRLVRHDIKKIFQFRYQKISEIFTNWNSG